MWSELLVLALISSNIVLSQSPEESDNPSNDVSNESNGDNEYETPPPKDYYEYTKPGLEDPTTNWDDYYQNVLPWEEYPEPNGQGPVPSPVVDSLPIQEQQSESRGYDTSFWLIVGIVVIGSIGIAILWVIMGVNLFKDHRLQTESKEQHRQSGSAESAANQTTSTNQSDETVRSSLGEGSASSSTLPKDSKP